MSPEKAPDTNIVSPIISNINTQDDEARPSCFKSTATEVLFVLTATMAVGMGSFTAGSTTVVTAIIGRDLHMSNAEITWISASSSLSGGAFLLFFGKFADLMGKRWLFIGSMFCFAVFAVAAGFCNDGLTLDIVNALMGLTTAAAVPPAIGSLGEIYAKPSKRKNAAFACFSAGNPLGFVVGMIASGIATQLFSWRASFWWLAILYSVFTIVGFFTFPLDTMPREPLTRECLKKFDPVGTLLAIAGIGMFSTSLSLGGDAPNGWKSSYVLVLLLLGILFIAAFILWERHYEHPLMPLSIWASRDFSLLNIILQIGSMGFSISAFWISLYIQRYLTASALKVALYLLPMAVVGFSTNVVAGLIMHRVSNKLLMGVGAAAYFLAFTLFALQRTPHAYWPFIFPGLCVITVGADLQYNVANMFVMSAMPRDRQSIAGGIFQTGIRLASTIGFGVATALFDAVQKSPPRSGYYAGNPAAPYAAVFWLSAGCAALSVALVFLLRVGTQGGGRVEAVAESVPVVGALGVEVAVALDGVEGQEKPGFQTEMLGVMRGVVAGER